MPHKTASKAYRSAVFRGASGVPSVTVSFHRTVVRSTPARSVGQHKKTAIAKATATANAEAAAVTAAAAAAAARYQETCRA